MRKKVLRSLALPLLLALTLTALAVSQVPSQDEAKSPSAKESKIKTFRDIAVERDVEVEEGIESSREYSSFEELRTADARAIVYGRIIDAKSFFDESGHPVEHGDYITTEYTVEVLRVLRDRNQESEPEPGRAAPAPLTTPLKIARNGGVVYVNGHRASIKAKGFESLNPGKSYVFFLSWSPPHKAYFLVGGASGIVMVNDDLSLTSLASSKDIRAKLRDMSLDSLIEQVK